MHRSRIPLSHDTLLLDALGKSKRHHYWNSARALSLKLMSLTVIYSSRRQSGCRGGRDGHDAMFWRKLLNIESRNLILPSFRISRIGTGVHRFLQAPRNEYAHTSHLSGHY